MTKRVQRYRVSSLVMSTLTGLTGELIINNTRNSIHVHDGVTPNGFEVARIDSSNSHVVSASQNGVWTFSQYQDFLNALNNIVTSQTNITSINANIASINVTITSIQTNVTALQTDNTTVKASLNASRFAAPTETIKLPFLHTVIPTGWTQLTGLDDSIALFDDTLAQAATTGGSWTISGLSGTQPNHTHTYSGTTSTDSGVISLAAGTFRAATDGHTHAFSGTTVSDGNDAVTISSSAIWRPKYVKQTAIQRSTWGAVV